MSGLAFSMWCPGRFRLTNKMLSDLRAAGFATGQQRFRVPRLATRRPWVVRDLFAAETRAIRLLVKATALRDHWPQIPAGQRARVSVAVFGHHRHDPDAWLLLAKPAIDGLVDAAVFASDRKALGVVQGFVLQSRDDEVRFSEASGYPVPKGPGFFLEIDGGD